MFGSTTVTFTSSAEKIEAYSTPMTLAPTTTSWRGYAGEFKDLVQVDDVLAVEADVGRAIGRVPSQAIEEPLGGISRNTVPAPRQAWTVRAGEARDTLDGFDAIAGELVLQHVHLVAKRDVEAAAQVLGADVLLGPVGGSIETALPPAGEVEHRLAQGLRGDGASVVPRRPSHRPPPALDDQIGRRLLRPLAAWIAPRRFLPGRCYDHDQGRSGFANDTDSPSSVLREAKP